MLGSSALESAVRTRFDDEHLFLRAATQPDETESPMGKSFNTVSTEGVKKTASEILT